MSLDESQFQALAGRTLEDLAAAIDDQLGDVLDIDVQGEIVTIDLADGGQYIVNKNAHLRQIWLSSPQSGAWHFQWDAAAGEWRSTRGGEVFLLRLLADELEALTGRRPEF